MERSAFCFMIALSVLVHDATSLTLFSYDYLLPEKNPLQTWIQPLISVIDWMKESSSICENEYTEIKPNLTEVQSCGSTPSPCPKSRYRSFDGTCNNLQNPTWGAAQEPFGELVKQSNVGDVLLDDSLPNPRKISLLVFPARNFTDHKLNLNTMQWGQVIGHDMALALPISFINTNLTCCDTEGKLSSESKTNPSCAPILIPKEDVINSEMGKECMNFVRSITTKDTGCTSSEAPAYPINTVSGYMDLSLIYGSTVELAKSLRESSGGRLLTIKRNGGTWPPQASDTQLTCPGAHSANEACYKAGDFRANQNPQLTVLQIILLKSHNYLADILYKMNKHWKDERIYQEARRINVAINQHINYYEYLPGLLGSENMKKQKLIYPHAKGYVNDYNPKISASVVKEHTTAGYRYFHTLIRGQIEIIKNDRKLDRYIRLSDWFDRPSVLEEKNGFDGLAIGLSYQPHDKSDQYFDLEITRYLSKRNSTTGLDLRAIDIQRGRDHKLASYVDVRSFCGLSVPKTFKDLRKDISKENVAALKLLYKTVDDIELVVAGGLENLATGALAGPTFQCILTKQFYYTRIADRFFYENGIDKKTAFTPSQLETIRKGSTMARLFCDHGINITKMQPKAFELVSSSNKIVPCDKLPSVNLTLWKEKTEE